MANAEDLMQMLATAEKLELSRYKLYKKNAAKVLNPEGKEALLFLMEVERKHLMLLKEKEAELKTGAGMKRKLKVNLPEKMEEQSEKFAGNIRQVTGDINIIRAAFELEKHDVDFYKGLSSRTDDKGAKELFLFLMKEEKIHRDLLGKNLVKLQQLSAAISASQSRMLFQDI